MGPAQAGERDHDPLAGLDGSVWYSGQMAGVIGHLDPKTGKFNEFLLPDDPGPHGLIMDKDGNVWFTANFKGYIGKLDTKTGEVKHYELDPEAAIRIRRCLTATGNFLHRAGRGHGGPLEHGDGRNGISAGADAEGESLRDGGDEQAHSVLCGIRRQQDRQHRSGNDGAFMNTCCRIRRARPRRVAITSDNVLYYTDFGRGYLGEFDTKTNKFVEGVALTQRTEIAAVRNTSVNDIIWYSESGVKPNTLVRFDPKTEKFQTWVIPSGGGVVRNMMHTADGKMVMTESGENKVALVTVKNGKKTGDGRK